MHIFIIYLALRLIRSIVSAFTLLVAQFLKRLNIFCGLLVTSSVSRHLFCRFSIFEAELAHICIAYLFEGIL